MEDLPVCRSRQDLLRAAVILAPELIRYLRRKGTAGCDAQDLMQEVYLRILKIQSLVGIEHPRAYLYKVATSVAYEHRLRLSLRPHQVPYDEETTEEVAASEPNGPQSSAELSEQLNSLSERLSGLSPRVRQTILWHHRDGYTCEEIAEKLSAATHRVKKYLVKGLSHCRGATPSIEPA